VRQLSLGERMRCEVAASLLHDPALLFLDEPTIGLDVSAKATIRELLRERSRRAGTTLLLTSHDTGDIEQVCDRVVIIHHGTILLDAPVDELKRRYLRRRRITVVTAAERFDAAHLEGATVVATAPHRLTVEVEGAESAIGALVQAVVKHTELRDLIVDDPPLDDVIRNLYARASA
jgi:ABC-2 type transport system ATP-binding protein